MEISQARAITAGAGAWPRAKGPGGMQFCRARIWGWAQQGQLTQWPAEEGSHPTRVKLGDLEVTSKED